MALEGQQQRLFIQACYLLGSVRLSLSRKPFKELLTELELHRETVQQPPLGPSALQLAHSVGWAVRAASKFSPWESTCLVQVLTAQKMLQKRGIAGAFYVGANNRSDESGTTEFLAHAWLKCSDEFITGESGHEQYTVVSSFSWS